MPGPWSRTSMTPVAGRQRPDGDLDGRARRACADGVADEVGEHLPQPRLLADDHARRRRARPSRSGTSRVGRDGSRACRSLTASAASTVRSTGPSAHRSALVDPGEREQVLDERAHAGGGLLDAAHGVVDLVGRGQRAHPVQLAVAADGGQRGAQLVRGVGDEPAHPGLGRGPRAERLLDLGEHPVERGAQPADLGVLGRGGHALGQVAGGDRGRGGLDLAQRPQRAADRPRAGGGAEQDDAEPAEQQDEAHVPDGALDVAERQRDDDRARRRCRPPCTPGTATTRQGEPGCVERTVNGSPALASACAAGQVGDVRGAVLAWPRRARCSRVRSSTPSSWTRT